MKRLYHPSSNDMNLERIFSALSDPVRLEIIRKLLREDRQTCSQLSGVNAKSSMSHHYKILRDAGLIRTEVVGREHFSSLRKDDIEEILPGVLDSIESFKQVR